VVGGLPLCDLVQHLGHHRQARRIAVLLLQVGQVGGDEVEPLGQAHGDEVRDGRVAGEQGTAVGSVAHHTGFGGLDRSAVRRAEQYRNLADQRAGTRHGIDRHTRLAHLQRARHQHPDATHPATLLHDDLAGGERHFGEVGRKAEHVAHAGHRTRDPDLRSAAAVALLRSNFRLRRFN